MVILAGFMDTLYPEAGGLFEGLDATTAKGTSQLTLWSLAQTLKPTP